MKHIHNSLPFFVLAILMTFSSSAQDIHFSQLNMTPLVLNPANAGTEYPVRAIINYRNQWRSVTTPFKTTMISVDLNLKEEKKKLGYFAGGINFYTDKSGYSQMVINQVNITGGYHLYLDDQNTIGAAIQGGYLQRKVDVEKLTWGNQFDGFQFDGGIGSGEGFTQDYFRINSADFSTGVVWSYQDMGNFTSGENYSIVTGLSVQHLNRPRFDYQNLSSDKLNIRWNLHSTGNIGLNTSYVLLPSIAYSRQATLHELYLGSSFLYRLKEGSQFTNVVKGTALGAGVHYRLRDAVTISGIVKYADYMLTMSYDINTSDLAAYSRNRGAMEFSLRYIYPNSLFATKSRSRFN